MGSSEWSLLWNGFEIPGPCLCGNLLQRFLRDSETLTRACAQLGFRGKLSCDGAVTESGDLFFTEVNGRLGGCTHVHVVAEAACWARSTCGRQLSVDEEPCPYPVRLCRLTFIRVLHREGVEFLDRTERRGVVILSEDTARQQTIEYLW